MRPMAIDRRKFLAGSAAIATTSASPLAIASDLGPLFAAARRGPDGQFSAAIFTADGRDVNAASLAGRGHDIAVCPVTRRCVAFARRPGTFAVAFSPDRRQPAVAFEAPADRHFYGHGVFSPDGRLLYTTENDFEGGRGIVGVYDATDRFRRKAEFPSHGIGPHDLALIESGRVLVVANGGLREHPDLGGGRRILNLEAIATSLVYIDAATGDLLERHRIASGGQLSLRHLDVGHKDMIVLGAQVVTGAPGLGDEATRLLYRHRRQQPLAATRLATAASDALAGYVSSVAVDQSGHFAAITSSKSGCALVIDVTTGDLKGISRLADVSGVARWESTGAFLLTSGVGTIASTGASANGFSASSSTGWSWDNHVVRL